jgi:gamma-glutamylcyclotransferase (GGCT)/AIG2-like uncharacterized protein YtfP
MNTKKLYFAYGMNTNDAEMSARCPDAEFIGKGKIKGYRLAFRSVADFEKAEDATLHGALWLISDEDEKALDRLEGYPNLYGKLYTDVLYNKKVINNVMIYKMNSDDYSEPSNHYYNCLVEGYHFAKLPQGQLIGAKQFSIDNTKPKGLFYWNESFPV